MNALAHKEPCLVCRLPLLIIISVIIGGAVAAYRLMAAENTIDRHEIRLNTVEKNVAVLPDMQKDLHDIKVILMDKNDHYRRDP